MSKKFAILALAIVLTFTAISPAFAAANQYSQVNNQIATVIPGVDKNTSVTPPTEGVTPQGKVTWTIKAIKEALKAKASQVDSAIKKAIDWLPVSQKVKDNLVKIIKVDAIIKALDVITNFSGQVEDALSQAIQYLGIPGWIANIIARAISAILF
ncbi:hypothetical protein CVV65_15120 [Kyrpidia spormannii]|uniref:Uncharacterized protein n=1 Tax=Kyrpidia spormannii TaxID=2055160 RepID=A0A2K8N9W5_9BACL|nr:hypothetical protein [Kyrpidia spormannii]ATY86093.1 hypothetical protein CVV65_15120 [Kyrpidia spormannii]